MTRFPRLQRSVTFTRWFVITYVLMQVWYNRYYMNPDGISYLDVAEAYLKRSPDAINAYWSPFYSWVTAVFLWVFKPSLHWEFPLVHMMNLLIFVFTLISFSAFLEIFLQYLGLTNRAANVCAHAWIRLFGYTLFAWSMMHGTPIHLVTPDLLMAGFIYLAFAVLLKIKMSRSSSQMLPIGLGLVLGIAALCKTIMFTLSPFFMLFLLSDQTKQKKMKLVSCLVSFVLVTSPFIYQISKKEHRFTLGTSPALNYYWFVTDYHPVKKIPGDGFHTYPAAPKLASIPPHYAPDISEAQILFSMKKQCRALIRNLKAYYHIGFPLFAPCIVLICLVGSSKSVLSRLRTLWPIIIPSLVAVIMYGLVYVEARYVAVFIVTLSLSGFSTFAMRHPVKTHRLPQFCVVLTFVLLIPGYISNALFFKKAIVSPSLPGYMHVAEAITANPSIQPGDKIAYVGVKLYYQYWLRLARVRIAASMNNPEKFFKDEDRFIKSLEEQDIKVVVTDALPEGSTVSTHWQRINPEYQMRLLASPIHE